MTGELWLKESQSHNCGRMVSEQEETWPRLFLFCIVNNGETMEAPIVVFENQRAPVLGGALSKLAL